MKSIGIVTNFSIVGGCNTELLLGSHCVCFVFSVAWFRNRDQIFTPAVVFPLQKPCWVARVPLQKT